MRAIDVLHLGLPKVICVYEVDGVLVDPGPESSVDKLLAELGDTVPTALLLTHIHFDHAGASGRLIERWPDLKVYVHERGAKHMVDPAKLVASATRLYGEDGMKELWGEVVPVPEENIVVLKGGETILDGAFEVAYTPGHASHHVSYFHTPTRSAFVGDTGGGRILPADLILAPTPPPDVDVEAWLNSLELIERWDPAQLCITHFGIYEDVAHQFAQMRLQLKNEAEWVERTTTQTFIEEWNVMLREHMDEEWIPTYLSAVPPEHVWLGLTRWKEKFGG